jgi:hypothetical protein
MTPIDQAALTKAIAAARAESKSRARQIDSMLGDRSWQRVAEFAAYSAQIDALGLMPWQSPPCIASLADLNQPFDDPRGARESAELLKKMLALGLSKFEPDPIGAIVEAEQRQQPAT